MYTVTQIRNGAVSSEVNRKAVLLFHFDELIFESTDL